MNAFYFILIILAVFILVGLFALLIFSVIKRAKEKERSSHGNEDITFKLKRRKTNQSASRIDIENVKTWHTYQIIFEEFGESTLPSISIYSKTLKGGYQIVGFDIVFDKKNRFMIKFHKQIPTVTIILNHFPK